MAKIWVKGFTRADGVKVKGHYRDVELGGALDRNRMKKVSNLLAMGQDVDKIKRQMRSELLRSKRTVSSAVKKRIYGQFTDDPGFTKSLYNFKG